MRTFFNKILNILFPPSESLKFIYKLVKQKDLLSLSQAKKESTWITSLFDYKDPRVRELVWQIKYREDKVLIDAISLVLYELIISEIAEITPYHPNLKVVILPVPISKERRKKRGFNQTESICKQIKKLDKESFFSYSPHILERKDFLEQTKMKRTDRIKNIQGQFKVLDKEKIKDCLCIIVDDVTTTGATLNEIRKVLIQSEAKNVQAFTIAH